MRFKSALKKTWNFLWHSDSIWSWLANVVIAFIMIRFVVYPLLGLLFATSFPIVAVVSESMEHGLHNQQICGAYQEDFKESFNSYWTKCGLWYEQRNLTQQEFKKFRFQNGFDKGDIILIRGTPPEKLKVGDVIIFQGDKPQPIIHRIVKKWQEDGRYYFQTKGDHNQDSINGQWGETKITEERILGKGVLRIPYLGWIKIVFVEAVGPLGWSVD
ncbi:MAG: signal peptidase I [Candidatus Woesearchaeota archaeon]